MIDAMQVFVRGFKDRFRGEAIDSYLTENGFSVVLRVDGESDNLGGLIETNIVNEDNLTEADPEAILVELRQRTGFDGLWIQTRRFSMVDDGEYGRDQEDEQGVDFDDQDDDEDDSTVRLLSMKLTPGSIQEFLSQLDDLDKDGFIEAASAITFELEERARYQAEKNDLDMEELLASIES